MVELTGQLTAWCPFTMGDIIKGDVGNLLCTFNTLLEAIILSWFRSWFRSWIDRPLPAKTEIKQWTCLKFNLRNKCPAFMHMLLIKCSFLFEANLFALNRQGFKLDRLNLQQHKTSYNGTRWFVVYTWFGLERFYCKKNTLHTMLTGYNPKLFEKVSIRVYCLVVRTTLLLCQGPVSYLLKATLLHKCKIWHSNVHIYIIMLC